MVQSLEIDRSELADTAQPEKLAELIISQVAGQVPEVLPLPITEVAKACGIIEINPFPNDAFEGALIQDANKTKGIILVRSSPHEPRSRFTIAHELGHFVNLRHIAPNGTNRINCTKENLRANEYAKRGYDIEVQANEFASGILMPPSIVGQQRFLKQSPEIAQILALHKLCLVSKEAAARTYAKLHGDDVAILFTKDKKLFGYPIRGGDFPWLDLKPYQAIFRDTQTVAFSGPEGAISEQEETDSSWWLQDRDANHWQLWEEVLIQAKGFRMTLLLGERTRRFQSSEWRPQFSR